MERVEFLNTPASSPFFEPLAGIRVHFFANGELGAIGLTTCAAVLLARKKLPYHTHPTSEAITAVSGVAAVYVEGRRYVIQAYDALHVPAEVAHSIESLSPAAPVILHTAFPTGEPTRTFVEDSFKVMEASETTSEVPEHLVRFDTAPRYELGPGVAVCDLFAGRFGARGLCGGYGFFPPGTELPCHYHEFDESITIVQGTAVCQVAGKEYELADLATICIPRGRPHRFLNRSSRPMVMIWVYAANEPDRALTDSGYCDGSLPFA